jgi:hypothetical protein
MQTDISLLRNRVAKCLDSSPRAGEEDLSHGRIQLNVASQAVLKDLLGQKTTARGHLNLKVAVDLKLAGQDLLAARQQLNFALAASTDPAAGAVQDNTRLSCGLQQCGAGMDLDRPIVRRKMDCKVAHKQGLVSHKENAK